MGGPEKEMASPTRDLEGGQSEGACGLWEPGLKGGELRDERREVVTSSKTSTPVGYKGELGVGRGKSQEVLQESQMNSPLINIGMTLGQVSKPHAKEGPQTRHINAGGGGCNGVAGAIGLDVRALMVGNEGITKGTKLFTHSWA
ncbi:hypothetical protein VNO80_13035 [Phaseolus coccineus]|uniref:Uncharacterized protein n=1 Tax=Phaseolus coccineus TaxID=3886 RepID=A0AAN9N0E6_PHACN